MKVLFRASLVVALVVPALASSCRKSEKPHDHASEHPEGHDHHADDHGHGDTPVIRITLFSERFELFAEHAPAVNGQEVTLLSHLTVLEDFRPLTAGELRLELEGPQQIRAKAAAPDRPGIYKIVFKAPRPGTYRGRLMVAGPPEGTIDGLEVKVYESAEKAKAAATSESHEGLIEFLKEQQWNVPFATAVAERGTLVPSIEVAGSIATPPSGSAEVSAPVAGRVVPLDKGLPKPGDVVKKGQLLAMLAPTPSSPEDTARATLAVSEANARAAAARTALDRAERLIEDEAISQREFEDARREAALAEEGLKAAKRVEGVFAGAAAGSSRGAWKLVAPIGGTLTSVDATPGASVSPSDALFRIVDTRELWLKARVPEQDAPKLRADRDARFQIVGTDRWHAIDVDGPEEKAAVVSLGRTVDARSRTVEVIYALKSPDPLLRVGGAVRIALPAGADFSGIIVPRGALVDNEGREVVYVQIDGEHFAERSVRTAARAGDRVGVAQGLSEGDRVVTRGAHLVRLADRSNAAPAHGHIH